MINSRKLKNTLNEANAEINNNISNMRVIAKDAERVSDIAKNVHIIIKDIDRQFESVTKLTKIDISFLFLAVALQVVRQYFLTNFKERLNDKESAKPAKKIEEKILGKETKKGKIDRITNDHRLYHPSIEEVTFNPVPFDQTAGVSTILGVPIGGGFAHRAKTPGHDAILGYIFGTANIATSTLTTWTMNSCHINYAPVGNILKPKATERAFTPDVFKYSFEKLTNKEWNDKIIMAISLFREAMHLKSDVGSKVSLPIPIVTTISPDFAEKLAKYGFDLANIQTVGKQAMYSGLINYVIAILHRLIHEYNETINLSLYEVRTRKILSYSNIIASASNIIAVAIGVAIGAATDNPERIKKSLSYLDIGGYMVTIYRIVTDYKFIKQIKQEFLEKEFYNIVMGEKYNF